MTVQNSGTVTRNVTKLREQNSGKVYVMFAVRKSLLAYVKTTKQT